MPVRPPGLTTDPSFRIIREYGRDQIQFLRRLTARYGDVARFVTWPYLVVLVNEPELIRDVLVTHQRDFVQGPSIRWVKAVLGNGLLASEGEFHLRQRRLMQPAFHRERIATYADTMARLALQLAERWGEGETLDVSRAMMELTLAIVGRTMFGADVTAEAQALGDAVTIANTYMADRTLDLFAEARHRLPLPGTLRYRRAMRTLDETTARFVEERRRSGDTGDLLSMLVAATEDGEGMSDSQLRDELLTIFLAGHETTANLLTWTLYLLSQHPEAAGRLEAEIDREIGDRLPAAGDSRRLPYAEMVLSEALRLFPPVWAMSRQVERDFELGPYCLPRGSVVVVSAAVTQRDPRWFPEPDRFDPERWTAGARTARPKFSFFPFGGGSRQCIGEGFAWLEATIVLAILCRRWRFSLVPDRPVETDPLITLRPKHGMVMTVRGRSNVGQ